ncbi:MAG: hypothetical protein ACK53U_06155 [Alphaproteobacteria bacterium]
MRKLPGVQCMYHWIVAFLLGLGGASLAQSLPPPIPLAPGAPAASDTPAAPQAAAPAQAGAPAERSLSERAGSAVGKAAEETTSAFGRAMNWTGRQLESAGQWTARQGENIATDKPATAAAPTAPAQPLPAPVPAR